jgi:hypothetical protein
MKICSNDILNPVFIEDLEEVSSFTTQGIKFNSFCRDILIGHYEITVKEMMRQGVKDFKIAFKSYFANDYGVRDLKITMKGERNINNVINTFFPKSGIEFKDGWFQANSLIAPHLVSYLIMLENRAHLDLNYGIDFDTISIKIIKDYDYYFSTLTTKILTGLYPYCVGDEYLNSSCYEGPADYLNKHKNKDIIYKGAKRFFGERRSLLKEILLSVFEKNAYNTDLIKILSELKKELN